MYLELCYKVRAWYLIGKASMKGMFVESLNKNCTLLRQACSCKVAGFDLHLLLMETKCVDTSATNLYR
jgi:hypothetical protein